MAALDQRAARLQTEANDRIKSEGAHWSQLEYRSRSERIAEEVFGRDWEWSLIEKMGGLPQVAVLRYSPAD